MGTKIYLTGHLKAFAGGETRIELPERYSLVGDALRSLWLEHPALRDRVIDEQGEIRTHVNIFVGDKSVKQLNGLATPIDADELHIFNAVSGG